MRLRVWHHGKRRPQRGSGGRGRSRRRCSGRRSGLPMLCVSIKKRKRDVLGGLVYRRTFDQYNSK